MKRQSLEESERDYEETVKGIRILIDYTKYSDIFPIPNREWLAELIPWKEIHQIARLISNPGPGLPINQSSCETNVRGPKHFHIAAAPLD